METPPQRILIIDDDEELCELLTEYLSPEGFTVQAVFDAHTGLQTALEATADLIILDVMLPGMSGFDVLRKLRSASTVPVIMLTAKGDPVDRVVGLELGADDYLPKPFDPRELMARIRAVYRRYALTRAPTDDIPATVRVGDVTIDTGTRSVYQQDRRVEVTDLEYMLLLALMRQAGQVVSRDWLARNVMGRPLGAFDRSIDVHISSLRKKLGRLYGAVERIKSVRGVGYQMSHSSQETQP